MNVLLSIKPVFIERIESGEKKYEFRKIIFIKDVNEVWIYGTSPEKKIVGKFKIGGIIREKPEILWKELNGDSGINKEDFFRYFSGTKKGFAIKIEKAEFFDTPINPYEVMPNFKPPQSFAYIQDNFLLKS